MKNFVIVFLVILLVSVSSFSQEMENQVVEIDGKKYVSLEVARELYKSLSESESQYKELEALHDELEISLKAYKEENEKLRLAYNDLGSQLEKNGLTQKEKEVILESKKAKRSPFEFLIEGGGLFYYGKVPRSEKASWYAGVGFRVRTDDYGSVVCVAGYHFLRCGAEFTIGF